LAELRGDQVRIEPVGGTRRTGGSSWPSLTRSTGSSEADYLNGEIVLLGREHGVPAPGQRAAAAARQPVRRRSPRPGQRHPGAMAALLAV
jgi:2-dehydropantoate 2-reductase